MEVVVERAREGGRKRGGEGGGRGKTWLRDRHVRKGRFGLVWFIEFFFVVVWLFLVGLKLNGSTLVDHASKE